MTPSDFNFGYRISGGVFNKRLLVDASAAFVGHAQCDPKANINSECYLSAFRFADDFKVHLEETNSTKGFVGPTWTNFLWFDIDKDELSEALQDVRKLTITMRERFGIAGDSLLIFYSGSKGFHVGLPTSFWQAVPAVEFHHYCRKFAEHLATVAGVQIDSAVYDRVRAFRAPNSRHQKTGRYKRFVSFDTLMTSTVDSITELATEPVPFTLPSTPSPNVAAIQDWQVAIETTESQQVAVKKASQAKAAGTQNSQCDATLNRATLNFIREGANTGDRHRLLFSAAANLAELGCTQELALALLSESALDSGLPPSNVRRTIECGLKHPSGGAV